MSQVLAPISRLQGRVSGFDQPLLIPLASLMLGAIIWEILGVLEISIVLPRLSSIVTTTLDVWATDRFQDALLQTLKSLAIAYPLALGLGLLMGFLAGRYQVIEWAFDSYVNMFLSLPLTALIPVILLVFGLGQTSLSVIIFLFTFFVVMVNTSAGVKAIDYQYREMARSFGAGEMQVFRTVLLPGSLPLVFAGIRLGTGRAIKGVIVGEQLMGFLGLGGLVQSYGRSFRIEETWGLIIALGLLGLIAIQTVRFVETRTLRRLPQGAAAAVE